MKLAVTNYWYDKKSAVFWNADGFLKMLDVLRKRDGWEIVFFKRHERTFDWEHDYVNLHFSPNPTQDAIDWKPDAILVFADFASPSLEQLDPYKGKIPIAMCYTGGQFTNWERTPDVIFVESKSYVDWMGSRGLENVRQVFGTNTEIFRPIKQPKIFDAVMTATFASWKRHNLFAEAMRGRPALTCGWWQEDEPHCWRSCQENGIALLHHQMPHSVNLLYGMSHTTVLTANTHGGSQRSVLESMAAGVPVIAMSDSDKTTEYVRESGFGLIVDPEVEKIREAVDKLKEKPLNPQIGIDYIKSKWTEIHYADGVKKGIEDIL